jgi:hypothetical protein
VRGIELLLNQRSGQFLSGEASYTYQVATTSIRLARHYGLEDAFATCRQGISADWDQRHAITVNVDLHFLETRDHGSAMSIPWRTGT